MLDWMVNGEEARFLCEERAFNLGKWVERPRDFSLLWKACGGPEHLPYPFL